MASPSGVLESLARVGAAEREGGAFDAVAGVPNHGEAALIVQLRRRQVREQHVPDLEEV